MGDDVDEETQEALNIAGGVASLGAAAVNACELLREGGGWQQWVGLALEAVRGVGALFTGAADETAPAPAPGELERAIELLEAAETMGAPRSFHVEGGSGEGGNPKKWRQNRPGWRIPRGGGGPSFSPGLLEELELAGGAS